MLMHLNRKTNLYVLNYIVCFIRVQYFKLLSDLKAIYYLLFSLFVLPNKMSGAVYQPTTMQEPQERWHDRPISYLASTVSQTARRPCGLNCLPSRNVLPLVLISSCVACFSLG